MADHSISVVIPVYNSDQTLHELTKCLEPVLVSLTRCYELILVNDGSSDGSWKVICDLAGSYPWIRGIDLMRNYGQQNALLCGIRAARHEIIVTMDDDLQNPPQEIPKLTSQLTEDVDVVYGYPEKRQNGLWRWVASRIMRMVLQKAMGVKTARYASAFRVFRAQVCRAFGEYQSPYVSVDVLLTSGTSRFAAVPVIHRPRNSGVSGYTFRKLLTLAVSLMTGFSTLFTGSFAKGLIGEYQAPMYRSMGKPCCCIRETTACSKQEHNDY